MPETLSPVLRVGLDVSPLALTKAGTARYLTNLLARARERIRRSRSSGTRSAARAGDEGRARPRAGTPWLSRAPRSVTASTSSTARRSAPRSARACRSWSRFTTLPSFGTPRPSTGWTRTYSARTLPRIARAASAIVVGSAVLARRGRRRAPRARGEGPRDPLRSRAAVHGGRARRGGRLHPGRLDGRAEEEPRAARSKAFAERASKGSSSASSAPRAGAT